MKFARRVFLAAGIYGIVVLFPLYFMKERLGLDYPPAITHPEFFYGFVGLALAWQVVFLIMSRDPMRYRWLILPAILEKLSYGIPIVLLLSRGEVSGGPAVGGLIDLGLAVLFAIAFALLGKEKATTES